ncbi:MAG: hypothetical protein PHS31_08980, partial [Victivallaceae bacterium]|nr:hypothetical protein [Victivallaceae bacterium]
SNNFVSGVMVAELSFNKALKQGTRYVFQVHSVDGKTITAVSLRAFAEQVIIGTYGTGDFKKYARSGIDGFNAFSTLNKKVLDRGVAFNCRSVSSDRKPKAELVNHPGIYGYLIQDEPDVIDYGLKDRPMSKRTGGFAPKMLEYYMSVLKRVPYKPVFLTLDLTFTPYNYFFYGPLADITNPDIYTNDVGSSVKRIDNHLHMAKVATAPRPFTFTYQSCWIRPLNTKEYVSLATLKKNGFERYVKKGTTRGWGFNTNPDEITIAMLYGIGNGVSGLFNYIDASEGCLGVLIQGSTEAGNWDTVAANSKMVRYIAPVLQYTHPITRAKASNKKIWVKTVLGGKDALLVVAVNEAYSCDKNDGFKITVQKTNFKLEDLPWLNANVIHEVTANGYNIINAKRSANTLSWNSTIKNGKIFLITSSQKQFDEVRLAAEKSLRDQKEALEKYEKAQALAKDNNLSGKSPKKSEYEAQVSFSLTRLIKNSDFPNGVTTYTPSRLTLYSFENSRLEVPSTSSYLSFKLNRRCQL